MVALPDLSIENVMVSRLYIFLSHYGAHRLMGIDKKPGNDNYRAVSVVTEVQGRPPNLFWGKRKGFTENIIIFHLKLEGLRQRLGERFSGRGCGLPTAVFFIVVSSEPCSLLGS